DIRIKSSVDASVIEAIGVDQVWAGSDDLPALTGKGVTVAVIDSGMDLRHNALRNRVLVTKDWTGGDGSDRYGHGTHVAAIIAGQAGKTPETQAYRGIAPGAYLVNLRVLGDDGSGDDLVIKPDLSAPGSHIASAEAADSYLSKNFPERHVSGTGANAVIQLSGTSMAAGVASGAIALLIDERDHLRPLESKAILET